eukprot:m.201958 g.201958  ORF g.201958 m.201958 type:complete len:74 (-) comp32807_c8_seq1:143-364(-)
METTNPPHVGGQTEQSNQSPTITPTPTLTTTHRAASAQQQHNSNHHQRQLDGFTICDENANPKQPEQQPDEKH